MPEHKPNCKEYYAEKQECVRMTRILQENGVVGFHATMKHQKRNCCGIKIACYFREGYLSEAQKPR